jgi:hypothetical protein
MHVAGPLSPKPDDSQQHAHRPNGQSQVVQQEDVSALAAAPVAEVAFELSPPAIYPEDMPGSHNDFVPRQTMAEALLEPMVILDQAGLLAAIMKFIYCSHG